MISTAKRPGTLWHHDRHSQRCSLSRKKNASLRISQVLDLTGRHSVNYLVHSFSSHLRVIKLSMATLKQYPFIFTFNTNCWAIDRARFVSIAICSWKMIRDCDLHAQETRGPVRHSQRDCNNNERASFQKVKWFSEDLTNSGSHKFWISRVLDLTGRPSANYLVKFFSHQRVIRPSMATVKQFQFISTFNTTRWAISRATSVSIATCSREMIPDLKEFLIDASSLSFEFRVVRV